MNNKLIEGPILIKAVKNLESEKYASMWGTIAKDVMKGFKGYGANIAKDYQGVKSGYKLMQKSETMAPHAKNLLYDAGKRRAVRGITGLGMRVGLPAIAGYQILKPNSNS